MKGHFLKHVSQDLKVTVGTVRSTPLYTPSSIIKRKQSCGWRHIRCRQVLLWTRNACRCWFVSLQNACLRQWV